MESETPRVEDFITPAELPEPDEDGNYIVRFEIPIREHRPMVVITQE